MAKQGTGSFVEKMDGTKLEIMEFLECDFKEGRTVMVAKLEDGTMFLQSSRLDESGEKPAYVTSSIWLTYESYIALNAVMMIFNNAMGEEISKSVTKVIENDSIEYATNMDIFNEK